MLGVLPQGQYPRRDVWHLLSSHFSAQQATRKEDHNAVNSVIIYERILFQRSHTPLKLTDINFFTDIAHEQHKYLK